MAENKTASTKVSYFFSAGNEQEKISATSTTGKTCATDKSSAKMAIVKTTTAHKGSYDKPVSGSSIVSQEMTEESRKMIEEAAYYLRKAKGFRSDPKADWVEAIARFEALQQPK